MRSTTPRLFGALFALCVAAAHVSAQAKPDAPPKPHQPVPEPTLVFDREVFSYQADRRRDPFTKLIGKAGLGPRFEDLSVKGIIFATNGGESLVLLSDGSKKVYRARRGDLVGNARVTLIEPTRVTFAVETFGQFRTEVLDYKPKPEGAKG